MKPAVLKRKLQGEGYREHVLDRERTSFGRSKECDVVINDTSLSRLHFRIEKRNDTYFLVDNNSSNGTFVNRRKVNETVLRDGDQVMTGRIHFIFTCKESEGDRTQPLSLVDEPRVTSTVSVAPDELPSGANLSLEDPPAPAPPPAGPEDTAGRPMAAPPVPMSAPKPGPPPVPNAASQTQPRLMTVPPVKRLLAWLIDGAVGMVLVLPGMLVSLLPIPGFVSAILSLISIAALVAHPVIGWLKFGKTIGKHLMGMHIVACDASSEIGLTPRVIALRIVGYALCGLTFGLLFLAVLFDEDGRGIHDKIAGTRVVVS